MTTEPTGDPEPGCTCAFYPWPHSPRGHDPAPPTGDRPIDPWTGHPVTDPPGGTGDRGERPTDAEYIAQLESYNRTLHARLAAERERADDEQRKTIDYMDRLVAAEARGDRAEDALRAIRTMISTTEDPTAANLTVWGICDHALAADPEGGPTDG